MIMNVEEFRRKQHDILKETYQTSKYFHNPSGIGIVQRS
jgi:hypothetical protein